MAVPRMNSFLSSVGAVPVFLSSALVSLVLVGVYRKLALRVGLVDVENARSSHQGVTPRGAGLVIVLLYAIGVCFYWEEAVIASKLLSLVLCPLALALVGLLDDYMALSSRSRLLIYFLLILAVIVPLGAPAYFPGRQLLPVALILFSLAVMMLWLINLFNFMDGINGIAGVEVLFVLISIQFLGESALASLSPLMVIVLGAVVGFLYWNFPLGKVFMGDVGSIFLGALLGIYVLASLYDGGGMFWSYMILLGVFFVDATYTLLVRLFSGLRITQAHRSHTYQLLSRKWGSHAKVVGAMLLLNLAWLFPLAWLARLHPAYGPGLLLLAYAPLVGLCYTLKAGRQS